MTSRFSLILALAFPLFAPAAEPLKQKVNLLESIKSGKVTYHVNTSEKQTLKDPPEKIWSFMENGQLKISGNGFGYVRTNEVYRDYHLVIEYKFTGPTMGSRLNKARDNGIFVHCHGPDGSYGGTWMAGIEAQIIEGGVGDILVLSPKMEDGKELITSVTAEIGADRDKEKIWKRGEPRQTITKGRINWEKRDVDWKDEAGFRGKDDVESRLNEWTRMEVIAKGDTLQYFVNGVLVNEAFECKPSEGYIFLQTEGAEMITKRYELYPLGEFKEKWDPVSASGGTDVPVKISREAALSPEDSRKMIELDGPFEVQLVAAEPLVRDPVEMTWDAQGRCFVADMIDYPLGAGPGQPPLSRIQQLIDDDKDGRYDRAITFADHVDHVQGLLPYKDGLIATTRTQILFIRDTNGDGVADERKPLVSGFNPNHSQLQVSAPRWGLDNCVYFNNGLDTKEIYPPQTPDKKENFARCNLRWDPATGKLEPSTGFGQFGGCFDDWGRHFFTSNRSPVMFAVMPYEAVLRNPHAGITQGWEDIAPSGAETRVYPLQLTHTTADAHAGTNTAACGIGVYRGDLMPELRGNIFVPDPTGQLVTRYTVAANGASLKATRVGDHTEFFRSRDEWTRPVNVTTGPDGALYICDIYRQYIDHARFFPESFSTTHNMRLGENEGRIWRIVPKGTHIASAAQPQKSSAGLQPVETSSKLTAQSTPESSPSGKPTAETTPDALKRETTLLRPIEPAPQTVDGLVAWLGHQNAWQRETAQRLLAEASPAELPANFVSLLMSEDNLRGRIHATWLLANLYRQHKMPKLDATPFRKAHPGWGDGSKLPTNASGDAKDRDFLNALIALGWMEGSEGTASGKAAASTDRGPFSENMMSIALRSGSQVWEGAFAGSVGALQPSDIFARSNFLAILVLSPSFNVSMFESGLRSYPNDDWIIKAIAATPPGVTGLGVALQNALQNKYFESGSSQRNTDAIRFLTSEVIASADEKDVAKVLSLFSLAKGKLVWWKPALLQGISEGLPKSGGKLGVKTLADLTSKPPAAFKEAAAEITALFAQVDKVLADSSAPLEQRLACIPLLAQRKWDEAEPVMRALLADTQPLEISGAALTLLKKFPADKTASLLYELLPRLGPNARLEVVKMLTGNSKTVKDFFERIDRGEVPKAFVDAETRWRYLRPNNPMYALAEKIFGKPSNDRAAVITAYSDAAKTKGDATKGHQIFSTICIACHRLKGEGVDVAPDITDVKIKEKEALLSDILDPNRMVEARWMAYQIDTKDGRIVAGIVSSETSSEVTVKMAGGISEAIPRTNIAKMKCLDASLMPVGLEAGITKEQMADLLAFLKGE